MGIKRVRQVFIVACEFERQCAFYRDALGMTLKFRDGEEWAQFEAGDVSFALAGPREALGAAPGTAVAVFEVTDLAALLNAVASSGGTHGPIRDMGAHGRTALVRDPGGAVVAALQKV